MNVSVLILTLDEEINLSDCIESVSWSDDVVVFDSFSTDRTVEIAQKAGARVVQRRFDNYAAQRNAAFTEVKYKHPWLLMVDADERVTSAAHEEILRTLEMVSPSITLLRIRRQDMFFGKWIRRSSGYPTWFGRLFRLGQVRVERAINEEYHTKGQIGNLQSHFLHYPFNKGIAYWFERHNRYSGMEAEALLNEVAVSLPLGGLFSTEPTIRRKTQKQLAYRIPGRPLLMFVALYFIRLGFLDGFPGFTYCVLRAIYEFMIDLKVRELRRQQKGLPT